MTGTVLIVFDAAMNKICLYLLNLMADYKHVGVSEGGIGYKEKLSFKSFICMYR